MISLRKFGLSDRQLIASRMKLSFEEAESMINEWNTGLFKGSCFEMYAIQNDDVVVGMISLYEHSKAIVSVGPETFEEYRRRGFCKAAIAEAIRIAKKSGYRILFQQVRTNNTASIGLHESLGFERDNHVFKNERGNDVYIYLKVI